MSAETLLYTALEREALVCCPQDTASQMQHQMISFGLYQLMKTIFRECATR